ncbi:MAG: hypothetical protein GYA36_17370 [Veillonellaceae bacterium]|nr:hypothetical protein [Veillonellaceae bacterium]
MDSIRQWLSEYISADAPIIGAEQVNERIAALNELFSNYRNMSPAQFKEAMTTAHFEDYFADALSRMFYKDYELATGEWRAYTYQDTAPDFRPVVRLRMTRPGTLHPRFEKGEAVATNIEDSAIEYAVSEYAEQFDVSWQAILNDDLGKIRETPQRMAEAAAYFEDEFVSGLYDNAVTQATLVAMGPPWSGTGRLTAANLAIGINAMKQRTDPNGNIMNIRRVHLVIPSILEIQARTILESILMAGVATNDKNVLRDFIAGVHVDPHITWSGVDVPWYLFADPASIPAVSVVRLNGVPGPFVYKQASNIEMVLGTAPAPFMLGSYATGDVSYTVEDIIGGWNDPTFVGVTDYRGIYYSSGTTP